MVPGPKDSQNYALFFFCLFGELFLFLALFSFYSSPEAEAQSLDWGGRSTKTFRLGNSPFLYYILTLAHLKPLKL